jgi:hypothetical protein
MEIAQGNSLCSYLKQTVILFSFTKSENRRLKQILAERGRRCRTGMKEWVWCKYFVHMYGNGKMIPVETVPRTGAGWDKGEWWRGWIQVWHIWYIVRTFVNATTYPQHNNKKKSMELVVELLLLKSKSNMLSQNSPVSWYLFLHKQN